MNVSMHGVPNVGARPVVSGRQLTPAPSLLPAPDMSGLASTQEALTILYALRAHQGVTETRTVETEMARRKEQSRVELARELAALEAASRAEREASGFWGKLKSLAGTVAKIAGVVAGAAAIVASGGAAMPLAVGIAAVALSAGGTVVRETKAFGEASDKVALGMEIAGATVGLGGAVATALGLGAAAAATGTAAAANAVGTTAQAAGALATGTSAGVGIRIAQLRSEEEHARADAEDARGQMAARQREVQMLVQALAGAKEAERDALDTTIKAIESCNQAADVAIAGVRG